MKKMGLILLGALLLAGCTAAKIKNDSKPTVTPADQAELTATPTVITPIAAKVETGLSDKNDEDTIKKELDATTIDSDFSKMVKP